MMQGNNGRTTFGSIQIGIVIFTLATAFIHLYLSFQMMAQGMSGTLFILNGLGYLALLAGLFLPIPIVKNYRSYLRILFILYTLVTIIAWVAIGQRDAWGYIDKAFEVLLVIFLWLDRSRK